MHWLRPLVPGYRVDASAFEWAADGKAMSALRSMKTLNTVAKTVSEKVGRRWIEVTFNGVLLGESNCLIFTGKRCGRREFWECRICRIFICPASGLGIA
jgi:hypothetical protein